MRRFRQRIIVFCALALSVLTVLTVFLCTYYGNKLDKLQKRAERAELELSGYRSEKVQIVCASENIKAGEALCEENLVIREFPAGFIPDNTILDISEAVGCTAKIQLFKNTYLTADMLYKTSLLGPEREVEYFCIDVNGNVAKGSYCSNSTVSYHKHIDHSICVGYRLSSE